MISRDDVISQAVDDCIKELYSLAQPHVEWDKFIEENKIYSNKYKVWERFNHLYYKEDKSEKELEEYSTYPVHNWEGKSITECIGPRPYEFYYLPKDVMKNICDSYISAYKMDSQKNLLDIIEILKNYCKSPIVDKYIEGELREDGTRWPGYRGYEHPDNLKKQIEHIIKKDCPDINEIELSSECIDKFFEFLDMAGKFYNWNRDLNAFNTTVYLGPSPNSNKEAVIENWKKYRNKDVEIDESKYIEDEDDVF